MSHNELLQTLLSFELGKDLEPLLRKLNILKQLTSVQVYMFKSYKVI